MYFFRLLILTILFLFLGCGLNGCAYKKDLADIPVDKLAEFSDRLGQANVKLYMYSGDVKLKNIKAFTGKLGCRMLYAYFYPDTVSLNEIPVEEIGSATSYGEVQRLLYEAEGYASWRYAAQCLAVIPFVTDCAKSSANQNCR